MRGLFKLLASLLLLAAHPVVHGLVTRVQGRYGIILISLLHIRVTTRMVRVGEYCGGDAPLSTPYLAAFHKREEVALGCQADSPSDALTQVSHSKASQAAKTGFQHTSRPKVATWGSVF